MTDDRIPRPSQLAHLYNDRYGNSWTTADDVGRMLMGYAKDLANDEDGLWRVRRMFYDMREVIFEHQHTRDLPFGAFRNAADVAVGPLDGDGEFERWWSIDSLLSALVCLGGEHHSVSCQADRLAETLRGLVVQMLAVRAQEVRIPAPDDRYSRRRR